MVAATLLGVTTDQRGMTRPQGSACDIGALEREQAPSGFTFSGIPVKFSLGGDQGLNIFASDHPASQPIPCDGGGPEGPIEGTVNPGSSSLSYDAATEQYTYVWKTERSWGGTCRRLTLRFTDGQEQTADFRFTR